MGGRGRRAVPRVGADVPGVEPPDDDVEPALWLRFSDGDDVGETDAGLGEGVDRDVAAVAGQRDHHSVRTGLGDWWGCRVEARGSEIGEDVLTARRQHRPVVFVSGATNVPRIGSTPRGSE
jgi:hypothetical protein